MTGHSARGSLTPDRILLTDRVALVTGAAAGIGAACATALAAFGADIVMCDRDADGLDDVAEHVRALGRTATATILDVRDRPAVSDWAGTAASDHGRIDVVVNNAGGGFAAPFQELSERGEDALVAENFTAVTAVTRATVPHLRAGGAIVNVTSVEAHRAAPGYAVYAAMKAGVANLTRSLALELAPRRIRVNAVAPDVIPTPGVGMLAAAVEARAARGEAVQPWPDEGHVDDVAGAVV